MIKKTIIVIFTLLICISPIVSAIDLDIFEDYDKYVTYSFNVKSREAQIGGQLTYTITVTNHTDMYFKYFFVSDVFLGSFTSLLWDDDELYAEDRLDLEPYETITIEYTRTVPKDIVWYKEGDKYYIDFAPSINYSAANPDDYIDDYDGEACEFFINRPNSNPIKIEITNIKDGSKYAKLSTEDNRHFLVYRDTQYEYLYANPNSIASLTNISDKSITIDNIRNALDSSAYELFGCILMPDEEVTYEVSTRYYDMENEISEKGIYEHKALFSIGDGFYYAVSAVKQFETCIIDVPDVTVRAIKNDDYIDYIVVNNSNRDIENLAAFYYTEYPGTYQQFQSNSIIGTLEANEKWEIQNKNPQAYSDTLNIGYYFDNCAYYWIFEINDQYTDTDYIHLSDFKYNYYKRDDYIYANNITLANSDDFKQGDNRIPLPTYTPYIRGELIQPTTATDTTPAPVITPTPVIKIQEVEKYYIPKWVWAALSLSVFAIVALSVYASYLRKKGNT